MTTLRQFVHTAFEVYSWFIIIRALLSWFHHDLRNPFIRFIYEITEPVLALIRRMFKLRMAVDFSPLIAIMLLWFLELILQSILGSY